MATTATATASAPTGKVRRSISCYSLPVCATAADDFPDENEEHEVEERREMYEVLKVRKETLNARLAERLAELKEMCLTEAAITGVLPRETPLHPNEPKPVIRRKVRTEFSLSDKLLTEPTTEEEKRLGDLELQFEIQNKIVEASKKLMNERNIKQRVKKQRKGNYDDAVSKLQRLDSDLTRLKKQLVEERRTQLENKNRIKRQVIEKHLSTPAPTSQIGKNGHLRTDLMPVAMLADMRQPVHGNSRLSRKRRGKIASSSSENDSQSMPVSPVVTREFKINPISPVTDDLSEHQPLVSKTVPPSTPTSILKKSRPAKEPVLYDEPDGIVNQIPAPDQLMRSNSLENVRRKSYISAVSLPPSAAAYRTIDYYNHHPLGNKVLPRNPPPPVPNSMAKRPLPPTPSQVFSSVSEPSVPDAFADEIDGPVAMQSTHCYDRLRCQVPGDARQSVRKEDVDISLKAVRSSVIRTPAITITTTSSSDTQVVQNNHKNQNATVSARPSPAPSPSSIPKPVRCRAYSGPAAPEETVEPLQPLLSPSPTPSSASTLLCRQLMEQEQHLKYEESKAMPPPVNLPPRKPKTSFNNIPPPLPLALHNVPLSRSGTPDNRSITPSIENDVFEQELVPPASPFISFARTYVETPRPDPIPMSPQVNSQTGVVVEVGTCRPSYEETKPFEFSDALKYSAKHRRRQETGSKSESTSSEPASSKEKVAPVPSLMNESFIASAAVSSDFHNEMVDWYDENVKKATVV